MHYLGLLGGMSWESTVEYYRLINRGVGSRLGGLHSAPLLVHSVDFAGIAARQQRGDWAGAAAQLAAAARGLERAGAAALLLCTNTMHHVAAAIEDAVDVPLLHIVDPTGAALQAAGVRRAALLGTRYTMELPFWRERLAAGYGVELVVPGEDERAEIHRVIYDELCRGIVSDRSRAFYRRTIAGLGVAGAEAVILGCTEITLLIGAADSPLPVFDTTALHAHVAVEFLVGTGGGLAASTAPNEAKRATGG